MNERLSVLIETAKQFEILGKGLVWQEGIQDLVQETIRITAEEMAKATRIERKPKRKGHYTESFHYNKALDEVDQKQKDFLEGLKWNQHWSF